MRNLFILVKLPGCNESSHRRIFIGQDIIRSKFTQLTIYPSCKCSKRLHPSSILRRIATRPIAHGLVPPFRPACNSEVRELHHQSTPTPSMKTSRSFESAPKSIPLTLESKYDLLIVDLVYIKYFPRFF